MTPRRLPPDARALAVRPPPLPDFAVAAPVGWTRKTFALGMHFACLALFSWLVAWPVVSPIVRGELAREFQPVLEAWAAWSAQAAAAVR